MSGVPCVNDTCSITSTVDGQGRLNIKSRLDSDGGIQCLGNNGLSVKLVGGCDQLLELSASGLIARRPDFQIMNIASAGRKDLGKGDTSALTTNTDITNNADCQRLIIMKTAFQFGFTTNTADNYDADGRFRIDFGFLYDEVSFEIGGYASSVSATRTHSAVDVSMFAIGAGATVNISSKGIREDSGTNVGGVGGAHNGLTVSHRLVIMDLGPGTLL